MVNCAENLIALVHYIMPVLVAAGNIVDLSVICAVALAVRAAARNLADKLAAAAARRQVAPNFAVVPAVVCSLTA